VLTPLPGGPNEPYNVRGHILTQARNKFRVKELSTIYRRGGEIVYDGKTLEIDDVLVSKGEAYIGPPVKHTRTDRKAKEAHVVIPRKHYWTASNFFRQGATGPLVA